MDIEAQVVNAFVDVDCGGNPAGVVLDADALTPTQKLAIAQQVGLSETAFVSRSAMATAAREHPPRRVLTPRRPAPQSLASMPVATRMRDTML